MMERKGEMEEDGKNMGKIIQGRRWKSWKGERKIFFDLLYFNYKNYFLKATSAPLLECNGFCQYQTKIQHFLPVRV